MPTATITPTEQAREWVMSLPEGSLFWLRDVPAPPKIASVMLCRLAKQDQPPVQRLANGFFWRPSYLDDGGADLHNIEAIAFEYAGPGSGYADYDAVNRMGWTTQCTAKVCISTMRRVRPLDKSVRYVHNPRNERRLELNFAEVSVIEAVRASRLSEVSWDRAVQMVADGTAISRLGEPGRERRISSEMIRWAADGEPPPGSWWKPWGPSLTFEEKIDDLCNSIPEVQWR